MIFYFSQIQAKEKDAMLTNEFQELVSNLEKNWKIIRDEIVPLSPHNKFSHKPLLSYIKDKENFFNSVFSLPMHKMENLIDSLFRRYIFTKSDGFEKLMPEQSFIKDFIKYIKDKKETSPVINCLLNYLINIKEILDYEKRRIGHPRKAASFTQLQ